MIINLYETSSAKNVINKVLNNQYQLNIIARKDFDVLNPMLILSEGTEDLRLYNYCTIPELNRSYFVDRIEPFNSEMINLYLSCDVLETYKGQVLSCNARYRRRIKTGDYYNFNSESLTNPETTLISSDKGFDGERTLILSTLVGESNG